VAVAEIVEIISTPRRQVVLVAAVVMEMELRPMLDLELVPE
jgi:hypothetical protein